MKNCIGIPLRGSKLARAFRREAHRTLPYRTPLLRLADAPEAIAARIFQSGKCQNNLR
ncbi:hypothetical protein [Nostoc sp.]|uniref:hypothetical protein n=1 Tax=Nostoc sp. TaxID=1180 RepID=UPI002FF95593